MFEVGKKYKHNVVDGLVIEVLYATDKNAFSRIVKSGCPGDIGIETTYGQDKYVFWKEYKEPRTITRWVCVYKDLTGELSFGHMWDDETKAITNERSHKAITNGRSHGAIATIPITYTEPH